MGKCWVFFLLLTVNSARQECFKCASECLPFECDSLDNLTKYIDDNTFPEVTKLTLRTPLIPQLNLTKFSSVVELDASQSDLSEFSVNLTSLERLYLSGNKLKSFQSNFPELRALDLSKNLLSNFTFPPKSLNVSSNNLTKSGKWEKLKYLDLSHNSIKQFDLGLATALKVLNLSCNQISSINSSSFRSCPNLEVLNLSSNFIADLPHISFNLTTLLQLDLRNNSIKTLSQKCFYGLNKLQLLDISLNNFNTIPPSILQYLPGLVQLRVSESKGLSSQDFSLLLSTRRLQYVDASSTNQYKIPSSLTQSIKFLNFSSNLISNIRCGDLDSYPLVTHLDLSHNKISYIENDALGRLEQLETLDLSNNLMTTVPHTLPSSLQKLVLFNNNISSVSSTELNGLSQLKVLDLSWNKITSLNESTFHGDLERLVLSGNPIQTLPAGTFAQLKNLKYLDISHMEDVSKLDMYFPVPNPNQIEELNLDQSPPLVSRLMRDTAALKTFKRLNILYLSNANITELRKDFLLVLPRVTTIHLEGNELNCSKLEEVFTSPKGIFTDCELIEEIPTTPEPMKETTLMASSTSEAPISSTADSTPELRLDENTTSFDLENITFDPDLLNNEVWLKENSPGAMYAFSSDIVSSGHPGLFIMLLLPIALVSTCLFINYSRLKRSRQADIFDTEVEISNFSNELW